MYSSHGGCPHTLDPLSLGFFTSPFRTTLPPTPTATAVQSISPLLKEMSVHDLQKGQNCQVADKCIDTTFKINIL